MPKSLAPKRAFVSRTPKLSIVSKKKKRDQPIPVISTPIPPEDRLATVAKCLTCIERERDEIRAQSQALTIANTEWQVGQQLTMIKNMMTCLEQERDEIRAQSQALTIANTEWQVGQQLDLQTHIDAVALQLGQQNVQIRHMTRLVLQLEGREHPTKYKHSLEFAHGAGIKFQHSTPQPCAFVHINPVTETFTFNGARVATVEYVDAKVDKRL
jgi:hypothetical protein